MTLARDVPERLIAVLGPFINGLCHRARLTLTERAPRFAVLTTKLLSPVNLDLRAYFDSVRHVLDAWFERRGS